MLVFATLFWFFTLGRNYSVVLRFASLDVKRTVVRQGWATSARLLWRCDWIYLELIRINYASPSSGEAYRDQQLTPNFELWAEFFCVSTCFHRITTLKSCLRLSVPRKKKSSWFRQYQSYSSEWYMIGKVFTSTTPWKPKNFILLRKNVLTWVFLLSCFVNIF